MNLANCLENPVNVGWWEMFWGIAEMVAMLLLLPGVSHALTNEQERLVGLRGVAVVVELIKPHAERLGLNRNQIQTDVELRLRKAGVTVLTIKQLAETQDKAVIYVNVATFIRPGSALCAYTVRVELKEAVTLANGFKTGGGIWWEAMIGTVGTENIRAIRGEVGHQVDKFINDYLAANPKK